VAAAGLLVIIVVAFSSLLELGLSSQKVNFIVSVAQFAV